MEKYKWLLSIISGAVVTFAKQYHAIILFVLIAVIFDWITGTLKAKATGEGINSKKATQGFWKKVALFVGLAFGFFLDYFIPYMVGSIGIDLPVSAFFGMTFGCYICVNELISIAENLYLINPSILPKWVVSLLTTAKKQIDNKVGDSDVDDATE